VSAVRHLTLAGAERPRSTSPANAPLVEAIKATWRSCGLGRARGLRRHSLTAPGPEHRPGSMRDLVRAIPAAPRSAARRESAAGVAIKASFASRNLGIKQCSTR
jgi:hypothetical protein